MIYTLQGSEDGLILATTSKTKAANKIASYLYGGSQCDIDTRRIKGTLTELDRAGMECYVFFSDDGRISVEVVLWD
jgi:hypothetical protein